MASTLQPYAPSSSVGRPLMKAAGSSAGSSAGFTSAFVAHNCTHDAVFGDVYLRTNRTNHTKIMRCFPHCCPDHRKRSYCGSAIHVQLLAPHNLMPSIAPEDLVVFGRFRPLTVAPLSIGERIPASSVLSSLQSKNPSKGEWVESKLVRYDGSKGTSTWLYEVNPSGRWYYPWSGAATIAMRATEHVFEALAFRRVGSGVLEFISSAKSPNFRLMSFRRGVAGSKPAKSAGERSDASEEASPKREISTREPTLATKKRALPYSPVQKSVFVGKLSPRRTPPSTKQVLAPMHLLTPAFSPSLLHPSEGSRMRNGVYEAQGGASFRSLHATHVRVSECDPASTTLNKLLPWLQDVPASAIGSRVMLGWERMVHDACEAHLVAARNGGSTGGVRLGLVPILSALEVSSVPSPSQGLHQASPLDEIDAAVRVLLHIWLDLDCARMSDASIQRFLCHGFYPDRQQFETAHAAWIQDTEVRAKRYLHTQTRVTWTQLSTTTSTQLLSHDTFVSLPRARSSSDVFSSRQFVAQCRERFIHRERAHHEAARSHKRQRTGQFSSRDVSKTAHVPQGLLESARVWTSRMEDVAIEVDGLAPSTLSLLMVVQYWKHLSSVRIDYDHSVRTLSVASVFNISALEGCFTQLVLDGRHRWFSCLPAGDATTGTTLMGFVIGDYVGYATSAGTVHVTTYLWPARGNAASTPAYAWHWTVNATSLSTAHTSVSVVIESARIQDPDLSASFETGSIAEKLRSITRWEHVCQVQLAYQAQ